MLLRWLPLPLGLPLLAIHMQGKRVFGGNDKTFPFFGDQLTNDFLAGAIGVAVGCIDNTNRSALTSGIKNLLHN